MEVGIVCGRCDTYAPIGRPRCSSCGNDLALVPKRTMTKERAAVAVGGDPQPTSGMFADPLKPRRPSPLGVQAAQQRTVTAPHMDKQPASPLSLEELMDQAKNYVCKSC